MSAENHGPDPRAGSKSRTIARLGIPRDGVVVTGGGSGIGRAVATRLASEGVTVVIVDRNAEQGAGVEAEITSRGGRAFSIAADVSSPDEVGEVTGRLEALLEQPPWALIHCAGIGSETAFLDMTPAQWRQVVDVDLSGTFYMCQAIARLMARDAAGGRIVTLASTAAERGGFGRAAYGAAKGGVVTLTRVMATELAALGITVNALAPGAIETELVAKMHSPETRSDYVSKIPAGRYGTPDEVAEAAIFLISEEARYINGTVMPVDGGFLAAGIMRGAPVAQPSQDT